LFAAMSSPPRTAPPEAAALERDRVLALLRAHAAAIRARGITRLALFGSVARGEAEPGSDVDLLIEELDRARHLTLFDLVDLQDELRALLGRPAHFAFASKLRPWLREEIGKEAVPVF
jgi:predicted nucleotidyltransferase